MATHAAGASGGSGTAAASGSVMQASAERLGRAFFGLAGLTYALIVLGALVRAHGAGLSCPDWPLCFGEVIPRLDFKVAFEFGHRVVAGSVAILFVGLSVATLRQKELASALRRPLAIAALLLAVQIVLGGLTVLKLLATWTVTSHLLTGNAFALALVLIGRRIVALGRRSSSAAAPDVPASGLARLATSAVAALLVAQVALGGLVSSSYAGLVCPDWPACMNGELFPTFSGIQGLHVLHRTLAYTLIVALPLAALLARPDRALVRLLGLASVLVVGQAAVGVANVLLRLPVEITALHSALAAALVCTLGVAVDTAWSRRTA
ncbi:MAG: COX15/CtaA family protein [Deltaproteobacteria bacterium]|nr:COX15/CtaA family protein [Deltaproteobacteria bacterium]